MSRGYGAGDGARYEPPGPGRLAEDASYDAPEPIRVDTSILMATEHRTGSTLVSWAMWRTGRAGLPYEYLLPVRMNAFAERWGVPEPSLRGRLGRWRRARNGGIDLYLRYRRRSFPPFIAQLAMNRATPNGVFSMKLMARHFTEIVDRGYDHELFPGRIVWIRMRRHDTVRQAVSWARAIQSRRYHSTQTLAERAAVYDRALIDHQLGLIHEDRATWTAFLDSGRIRPLDLWYEDVTADYEGTLASVFDHADLDQPDAWPDPPLQKLADDLTDEWVQRYDAGR
jgi:LPS sulfotransferase NodH